MSGQILAHASEQDPPDGALVARTAHEHVDVLTQQRELFVGTADDDVHVGTVGRTQPLTLSRDLRRRILDVRRPGAPRAALHVGAHDVPDNQLAAI